MTSPQSDTVAFPIIGLDISETKIGVAMAEHARSSPQPCFTYQRITRARDLAQCVEWVRRYQVAGVVLGLPLNMDGTPGPRAQWMRRFGRELQQQLAVPVWFQDERLTTVEAEEALQSQGASWEERAERVDAVAAALILERFIHER